MSTAPVLEDTFTIPEGARDIDTGMDIRYGDRLVFSASGEIWAGVWFTGLNGPQGWGNIDYSSKWPLPASHPYCLLGKLDGRYFYLGTGWDRYYRGRNSRLFLRINDDAPGNGSGAFTCHVAVYRGGTRELPSATEQGRPVPPPELLAAIEQGTPVPPPELADFQQAGAGQ